MTPQHDDLYRQLALRYTETWGEALQKEAQALGHAPTPGLDRKVRAALRRRRGLGQWAAIAAAAACVALLLYISPLGPRGQTGGPTDALTAESAATTRAATTPTAAATAQSPLPLDFQLPGQFSVDDVTVDRGQTVYRLADTLRDPVVLTLEQDAQAMDITGLTALPLAGQTVYAKATADYSLVTFERGGLRYIMTCRYDVNTLLALSRAILV